MIQILAQGRLGNQMFQYAFGYAASKKLGTISFINGSLLWNVFELDLRRRFFARFAGRRDAPPAPLPHTSAPDDQLAAPRRTLLWELFELDAPRGWNIFKTIVSFLWMRLRYRRTVIIIDNLTPPRTVMAELRDGVVYSGYFQSEQFFFEYRSEIQKRFTLLRPYRQDFARRYGALVRQHKLVVVHVRRTDYAEFHLFGQYESVVLPFAYFRACLERIEDLAQYRVIFISDDIAAVEREFQDMPGAQFSRHSTIIDFQLLQHADIVILSNSSFSWWGAYLNPKNPRVLAPRDWLGFAAHIEYPAGVLMDRWEIVDVPGSASPATPHR